MARSRSRGLPAAVLVLTVAVLLPACGGPDEPSSRSEPRTTTPPNGDDAAQYVGLSKDDAITKAEDESRPWRVGREDDQHFALTRDYVEDRVTFEIDGGRVTAAHLG